MISVPPTVITLILSVLYNVVAEWREFSFADRTTHSQIWLIFCLIMVLGMVLEFAVVYIVFGTMRTKLRGLCGAGTTPEDMQVGVDLLHKTTRIFVTFTE